MAIQYLDVIPVKNLQRSSEKIQRLQIELKAAQIELENCEADMKASNTSVDEVLNNLKNYKSHKCSDCGVILSFYDIYVKSCPRCRKVIVSIKT